jgi:hypothetical protein
MIRYIILLLAPVILFSSCRFMGGKRVRGNGTVQTEDRNIRDFKGIKTAGSFDVFVTSGNEYAVRVESDENLLPYIETELDGNNLEIKEARGFNIRPSKGAKIYVTAPVFNKFSTAGSGNISGSNQLTADDYLDIDVAGSGNININIKATDIKVSIAGSGNVNLSGEGSNMKGSIAGSGDIKAKDLLTSKADIHIAGSGSAEINAKEELNANIAGSGDVKYVGQPKTSSHVAGSGSVKSF